MTFRLLVGSFLAAVVMMAWGFAFWAVSGVPMRVMKPLPDAPAVVAALKATTAESGHYFYPFPAADASESQQEECMRLHREGPTFGVVYNRDGSDPMSPRFFALGFGHLFLSALLAGLVLLPALPSLPSYPARVGGYLVLLGLFAAFFIRCGDIFWFHAPPAFPLMYAGFEVVNALAAAIVLAAVVRPRTA